MSYATGEADGVSGKEYKNHYLISDFRFHSYIEGWFEGYRKLKFRQLVKRDPWWFMTWIMTADKKRKHRRCH